MLSLPHQDLQPLLQQNRADKISDTRRMFALLATWAARVVVRKIHALLAIWMKASPATTTSLPTRIGKGLLLANERTLLRGRKVFFECGKSGRENR